MIKNLINIRYIVYIFFVINILFTNTVLSVSSISNDYIQSSSLIDDNNFSKQSIYNNITRILVISDLHCDLERFIYILKQASILNNNLEWIAKPKDTMIVQLGDQLDPKVVIDDTNLYSYIDVKDINPNYNVIYFTEKLKKIAKNGGGKLISLIGNHEYLNKELYDNETYDIISERRITVKINDFLFCHGGILKSVIDLLEQYNKNYQYINDLWYRFMKNISINNIDKIFIEHLYNDENSVLFVKTKDDYDDEKYVLNKLKSKKVIVGHKQRENIIIDDNTIYTDMLLQRAFQNKNYQYLDIVDNNIFVKSIQYEAGTVY
jgi:hypothetical protein